MTSATRSEQSANIVRKLPLHLHAAQSRDIGEMRFVDHCQVLLGTGERINGLVILEPHF